MEHTPGFIAPRGGSSSLTRLAASSPALALLIGLLGTAGCQAPAANPPANGKIETAPKAVVEARSQTSNAGPGSVTSAQPAPALEKSKGPGFDPQGTWSFRWRMRDAGDARDQDAYSVLSLNVGRPGTDRVSGHLLARLSADLDGRGDADTQRTFGSLQDTHGKSVYADLYEASVDVNRPFDAPVEARIGRQYETSTPEIAHFDGVRVQSKEMGRSKIVAGAYGGVPVRLYEATSISDQIYGAWAESRPWSNGRVRADWMHVNEDAQPSDFSNDLLGLSLWQRFGEQWLVDGAYTRLESENRDVRLRATWNDGKGDWLVQGSYYELLEPQRAFAQEFDPLFSTLQQFEPYRQYRMLASKNLGEHVRLDLGGDLRRLEDSGDESRLNHDYDRGYATVVVSDLPAQGLALSLTGDTWESDQQDIRTWGADLTWTPNKKWRASVGSAYALYKYDVVQDVERDDVRTWYGRLRHALGTAWTLDLEYAYDDDDFDNHQLFMAGATWHF